MLFRRLEILIRYYKNIYRHKMRRGKFPEEKHGGETWRERIDSKLLGGIHERKDGIRNIPCIYYMAQALPPVCLFQHRARIKSRLSFLFQPVAEVT